MHSLTQYLENSKITIDTNVKNANQSKSINQTKPAPIFDQIEYLRNIKKPHLGINSFIK